MVDEQHDEVAGCSAEGAWPSRTKLDAHFGILASLLTCRRVRFLAYIRHSSASVELLLAATDQRV